MKQCTKLHGMTMTGIKEKINNRMDMLQYMMENQMHLTEGGKVLDQIASVSKFWSALSEEDRDYIEGARYAHEHQMEWKV